MYCMCVPHMYVPSVWFRVGTMSVLVEGVVVPSGVNPGIELHKSPEQQQVKSLAVPSCGSQVGSQGTSWHPKYESTKPPKAVSRNCARQDRWSWSRLQVCMHQSELSAQLLDQHFILAWADGGEDSRRRRRRKRRESEGRGRVLQLSWCIVRAGICWHDVCTA